MSEEINDANTDTGAESATVDSTGPSPDVEDLQPVIDEDGFVSTTEFQAPEAPAEPVEEEPEADPSDAAEQNTAKGDPSQTDFHEHPRFKELIAEKNELKKEIEALKVQQPKPKEPKPSQPKYDNLLSKSDEELQTMMMDDPKGFIVNLGQQLYHEMTEQQSRMSAKEKQESIRQQAQESLHNFFADREDGQAMLNDGRIGKLMDENPMHNPISAYYELAQEGITQKAVDKAVKEAEARIYKTLKAKGAAGSASTTKGGMSLGDSSPEVKNPEKFGGAKAVAVKRFMSRMGR